MINEEKTIQSLSWELFRLLIANALIIYLIIVQARPDLAIDLEQ